MSACEVRKENQYGHCPTPGCQASGRYSLWLCGLVVKSDGILNRPELYCKRCATSMEATFAEESEEVQEKAVGQALHASVYGRASEKAEAIFALRGWGFEASEVSVAREELAA